MLNIITLEMTLHLRPLRSADRAGVEPRLIRAARRYAAAHARNKRWLYVTSLPKYWGKAVYFVYDVRLSTLSLLIDQFRSTSSFRGTSQCYHENTCSLATIYERTGGSSITSTIIVSNPLYYVEVISKWFLVKEVESRHDWIWGPNSILRRYRVVTLILNCAQINWL